LALGIVVHHVWRDADIFFNQLALAASLVGQVVLVGALWQQLGLPAAAGVYGTAVVVPLFLLYRGGVHRFLSALAALTLGSAAFVDLGLPAGQTVLFGVELLIVALVFAGRGLVPLKWRVPLRPIGYAATVTAVWTSSELFLLDYLKLETLALHSGLVAAVLVYLAYEAVREGGTQWLEAAFWGGGAAVALSVVSTPGLLVAMAVLFLGIWRGETALGALGVVALGYYLWAFYYSLEMTLLGKSAVLVASGLVLLALRAWFALRPWTPDGPAGQAPNPSSGREGAR
jgi:hypothetical protein